MVVLRGLRVRGNLDGTQPNRTKAQWQTAIAHVRELRGGCYHASYPALQWHAVKCAVGPKWPLAPALGPVSAGHGAPATVGSGGDYVAKVTGLISQATGSFADVSPRITETGKVNNLGQLTANAFTLQLNSQFFSGSPACSGSINPSGCQAWQQFAYFYQNTTTAYVFMQYWLIGYGATCPSGSSGWTHPPKDTTDCFLNSKMAKITPLTASQLATVQLSGSAASGGEDGVSLAVGSGQAELVTNSDSVLDLARRWNETQWGVYGDGSDGVAKFGANTTLEAKTAITTTGSSAPTCAPGNFTGESNNLSLTSTPALGHQPLPTIASMQTNGTTGARSCVAARASGGLNAGGLA